MYLTMIIAIKFNIDSGNNNFHENFINDAEFNLGYEALISIINITRIKVFKNSHIACSK